MSATNALPLEFVKSSTDESKTIFETVMKWKMDQKKADTLKWDEEYQKWRDSPDAKAIKEHLMYGIFFYSLIVTNYDFSCLTLVEN